MKKAFTLVELLIVITLIAILSVAILATLNPIEQTNKARDAQFKNDAAEVLSAYERYFASQNAYPWNSVTSGEGTTIPQGSSGVMEGNTALFGVIGQNFGSDGVGTTDSPLVQTSEIKESFLGKAPFKQGAKAIDMFYAYTNGQDTNYVCFFPKAKANRSGEMGAKLKCLDRDNRTISGQVPGGCELATSWTDADLVPNAEKANMMCVPE